MCVHACDSPTPSPLPPPPSTTITSTYDSSRSEDSVLGNDPVRRLLSRYKNRNPVSCPMVDGSVPVKELPARLRYLQDGDPAAVSNSVNGNNIDAREHTPQTYVRYDRELIDEGIAPHRLRDVSVSDLRQST
jgi:hypothetical protein